MHVHTYTCAHTELPFKPEKSLECWQYELFFQEGPDALSTVFSHCHWMGRRGTGSRGDWLSRMVWRSFSFASRQSLSWGSTSRRGSHSHQSTRSHIRLAISELHFPLLFSFSHPIYHPGWGGGSLVRQKHRDFMSIVACPSYARGNQYIRKEIFPRADALLGRIWQMWGLHLRYN